MCPLKIKYEDFFNAVPDMTENHLNNAIPAAAADTWSSTLSARA